MHRTDMQIAFFAAVAVIIATAGLVVTQHPHPIHPVGVTAPEPKAFR